MLIDNYSDLLMQRLICPISRDRLFNSGYGLTSETGYEYPGGDFRIVAGLANNPSWIKGQEHYEEYHRKWITQPAEFYDSCDQETHEVYRQIPLYGDVLDVGGGYGTVGLQARIPLQNLTCIDPMVCLFNELSPSFFKEHYKELEAVVRIPGFAEYLPFKNQAFDTVHMRSCLDHFANPHLALLEARRVIKSDGQLVIGIALEGAYKLGKSGIKNKIKKSIKNSFIGNVYEYFFDSHMFHPTNDSIRLLLNSTGFAIKKIVSQPGYSNVVYIQATKLI